MHEIDQAKLLAWAEEWFDDHELGQFKLVDDDPLKDLNGIYYKAKCRKCGQSVSIRIDTTPYRIIGDDCLTPNEISEEEQIISEARAKLSGNDLGPLDSFDSADIRRGEHVFTELWQTNDPDILTHLNKIDKSYYDTILEAFATLYLKKISGVSFRYDKVKKHGSPIEWRGCKVLLKSKFYEGKNHQLITKAVVIIPNSPIRIFYKRIEEDKDQLSLYGLANANLGEIRNAVKLIKPFKEEIAAGNRGKGRSKESQYDPFAERVLAGESKLEVSLEAANKFGVEVESARRSIDKRLKQIMGN